MAVCARIGRRAVAGRVVGYCRAFLPGDYGHNMPAVCRQLQGGGSEGRVFGRALHAFSNLQKRWAQNRVGTLSGCARSFGGW